MACLITHANLIRQKCYTSLLVGKSAYSYCFHWWSLNLLFLQTELLLMSYKICCDTETTQHSSMTALRYCCKLTCLWSMIVTDMSMSWCTFRFLVLSISIISIDRVVNTLIGQWRLHLRRPHRLHALIWTLRLLRAGSPDYQWRRAWSNHHKAVSLCCATISEQILRLSPWLDQQGSVPTPGAGLLETHVTFWYVFTLVKTPSLRQSRL